MSEILYDSDASLRLISNELRNILRREVPTDRSESLKQFVRRTVIRPGQSLSDCFRQRLEGNGLRQVLHVLSERRA